MCCWLYNFFITVFCQLNLMYLFFVVKSWCSIRLTVILMLDNHSHYLVSNYIILYTRHIQYKRLTEYNTDRVPAWIGTTPAPISTARQHWWVPIRRVEWARAITGTWDVRSNVSRQLIGGSGANDVHGRRRPPQVASFEEIATRTNFERFMFQPSH